MGDDKRIIYRFSSMPPLVVVGDEIIEQRGLQGVLLKKSLLKYGIVLRDLANKEVPYSIKNELLNIAFYIVENVQLLDRVNEKRQLPLSILCKEFGKTKRFLEEWKDNIITYVVILSNPKYKYIQDYLRVIEDEDKNVDAQALSILKESKELRGIIIAKQKRQALILTSMGDFKKIKISTSANMGEEVSGIQKKTIQDYKFHISLIVAIFIVVIGMFVYRYNEVIRTLMVGTTSNIIIEVNYFDRVKDVYSRTEKGKKMVSTIDIKDKNIDDGVLAIIKYANENEMMPQHGIVIGVYGKPLEYGVLKKTEDFIYVEQIDLKINNSGTEQNLY